MKNKKLEKINRSCLRNVYLCFVMFFCLLKENNIAATVDNPLFIPTSLREVVSLAIIANYLPHFYKYIRGASLVVNPAVAIPMLGYLGGKQILDEYRATKLNDPNLTSEQIDEILKYFITEGKNNVVIRKRLKKIEIHRQTMSNLEKKNEKLFFEQYPDLLGQYFADIDLFNYGKGAVNASGNIFSLSSLSYKWKIFEIMSYLSRLETILPHITEEQFVRLISSPVLRSENKNVDSVIRGAKLDIREKFSKIENNDQKMKKFFEGMKKNNTSKQELEKLLTFGESVINSRLINQILEKYCYPEEQEKIIQNSPHRIRQLNEGVLFFADTSEQFFKHFPNLLEKYFEDKVDTTKYHRFADIYCRHSCPYNEQHYPSGFDYYKKINPIINFKIQKLYELIKKNHITDEQTAFLMNKIACEAIDAGQVAAEDMEAVKKHFLSFANKKEDKIDGTPWYKSTTTKILAAAGLIGILIWDLITSKKNKNKKDDKADEEKDAKSSQATKTQ